MEVRPTPDGYQSVTHALIVDGASRDAGYFMGTWP